MSGGGTPATTQQVSKVELPAWVNQASQENYNFAKTVAGRPLEQFSGPTVADPSAMTTQGYGMLTRNAGSNDATYANAEGILNRTANPLDIQPYLNPYTNEVEQRAVGNANTALTQQLRGIDDAASKARAFGGSRHAIQSGVAQGEGVREIGDLSARLRAAGFDTATQTALADRSGMRSTAAGLLSTAGGRQASQVQDASSLLAAGGQEQTQRQKVIDAQVAKFNESRNYPVEQLNLLLASLGMSPYGRTETSNKTATSEDRGPDWATIGLGALKTLPSILAMSDRNTKTDIKKLTDGDIPMYSYRYKGDPKSYPKVVGPMAQDIEKKFPTVVKKVGKFKTIDVSNLMEALS